MSVHELVQLSLPAGEKKTAEEVSHDISFVSLDVVEFLSSVKVGDILQFRAKVTYYCPKTSKVRVHVESETIDPKTGKPNSQLNNGKFNTYQLTYHVK